MAFNLLNSLDQVLVSKVETTKYSDATPDGTNAIKCGRVDVTINGEDLNDISIRNTTAAIQKRYGGKTITMRITVMGKGSGALGTAPEISPLLQACKHSETVSAGVKVEYKFVGAFADQKTCTIYLYRGGRAWKVIGCMGNASFNFEASRLVSITFDMQGRFSSVADAVAPTPTYQDVDPEQVQSIPLTFGGESQVVAKNITLQTGIQISLRRGVGAAQGIYGARAGQHDPTWASRIEAVAEADHPFCANKENQTNEAIAFTHGTVAGNVIQVAIPNGSISNIGFTSEDNIEIDELSGQCLESSDGAYDNWTLTFR